MSSCLSGTGARFDLDIVKSPPCSWSRTTSSQTSSSPSSTISESSNSPLITISTTKPRTPRKRPNQTYNEAATLLSTAYPNLFTTPNLKTNPNNKFTKSEKTTTHEFDSSELFLPFGVFDTSSSFLLHGPIHQPIRPNFPSEPKPVKPCQSPGEISSMVKSLELNDDDDFDAESILDEEIEEGIDSIMGGRIQEDESNVSSFSHHHPWIGFGGKFDFRLGLQRAGVRALRHVDEGNWWNFPAVDMLKISPKICSVGNKTAAPVTEKKKKKKVVAAVEKPKEELLKEIVLPKSKTNSLLLKLNYDGVRKAWSDRGTPFADDSPVSDAPGNDVNARLSQIDLLWENGGGSGGVREASVLRYKEKRRTRLFSKKIRYQVRKVNADRRPRMKGRFVRRLNGSSNEHKWCL
ncbi:unnamed protein product [Trifolium pratense]|uniref:Uncharacterized protein n=1 Tax=Trifolium pratense TaxID=57577 RepID=A0ACB0JZY8_TRIPR|nr:unnamed protein product [Trifolium pratense]